MFRRKVELLISIQSQVYRWASSTANKIYYPRQSIKVKIRSGMVWKFAYYIPLFTLPFFIFRSGIDPNFFLLNGKFLKIDNYLCVGWSLEGSKSFKSIGIFFYFSNKPCYLKLFGLDNASPRKQFEFDSSRCTQDPDSSSSCSQISSNVSNVSLFLCLAGVDGCIPLTRKMTQEHQNCNLLSLNCFCF